jgi:GDP-L-fucose synthase
MIKHHSSYVAGHRGLVGSAICRALRSNGYTEILTRNHEDLDLCDESAVDR